jgi:hypothetical protein
MATMYPPEVDSSSNVSHAERQVFELLKKEVGGNWVILHSLWLRTHSHKMDAEADFVAIGDQGVVVIEVKGGLVERTDDGRWKFSSVHGKLNATKNEGPFEQARGALYGLRTHLRELRQNALFDDHVWGYAVITPECTMKLPSSDPEISSWMYLDEMGVRQNLEQFLENVVEKSREQRSRTRSGKEPRPLSPAERHNLVTLLRPAIGYLDGLGRDVQLASHNIYRFTDSQRESFAKYARSSRIILKGGAGTGKTLFALSVAERQAISGDQVLFLCYNRHLAHKLRQYQQDHEAQLNIEFYNYHQFVRTVLHRCGIDQPVPEDWDEFNRIAVDLMLQAADSPQWKTYDYLIVDEGQDLMNSVFGSVLELVLEGGLKKGRWMICVDPRQSIFEDNFDAAYLDEVSSYGEETPLIENCRNTREIHAYVCGLSQLPAVETAVTAGPSPTIRYYADRKEFRDLLKKSLNNAIRDFREAGLDESGILVLFATKEPYLSDLDEIQEKLLAQVVAYEDARSGCVTWSTVQGFKGLEAKMVILVGIQSLDENLSRKLLYVGGSRAQAALTMLLSEDSQGSVGLAMQDILGYLVTAEGSN